MTLRATDERSQMIADLQGEVALLKCALRIAAQDARGAYRRVDPSKCKSNLHLIAEWMRMAAEFYPRLANQALDTAKTETGER